MTPTYTSITPSYTEQEYEGYDYSRDRSQTATYFSDTDNFTHTRYSGTYQNFDFELFLDSHYDYP